MVKQRWVNIYWGYTGIMSSRKLNAVSSLLCAPPCKTWHLLRALWPVNKYYIPIFLEVQGTTYLLADVRMLQVTIVIDEGGLPKYATRYRYLSPTYSRPGRTFSNEVGPKDQLNSEWIYEVIAYPKIATKNYRDFCPTL